MTNLNIDTREYSVSVKATRDYQSVQISEGFTVIVDDQFNAFDFESEKEKLKNEVKKQAVNYLKEVVEEKNIDDNIDIDINE